jgi:hypothetical protein
VLPASNQEFCRESKSLLQDGRLTNKELRDGVMRRLARGGSEVQCDRLGLVDTKATWERSGVYNPASIGRL